MADRLLTANSEMRGDGVVNWTLPAWVIELSDGTKMNCCPQAGVCVKVCYARNGTYLFPAVRAKHIRNLEMVLDDLEGWKWRMIEEVRERQIPAVRIHDAGDFFSDEYLLAWLSIAWANPRTTFYAYTKEVSRFKRVFAEAKPPKNLKWLYSLGGKEDHLLDLDVDRHADVFPDTESLEDAGYESQDESDLLVLTLPGPRIGIPTNNIPAFRKIIANRSFGEMQQDQDAGKARNRD